RPCAHCCCVYVRFHPGLHSFPTRRSSDLRLEEKRARTQLLEGRGSVYGFCPGQAFTFGRTAGDAFAGDWLLVDLEHRFAGDAERSEEHTSELQSRENLVCRLLLEKKKELT